MTDAVLGLKGPARALATVGAQTEKHHFLTGTSLLNAENEVRAPFRGDRRRRAGVRVAAGLTCCTAGYAG